MRARLRDRLRDEAGFTLAELLVAMSIGLVIVFAAFGLIDLATRVTSQVTDRVDATTVGRAAMEDVIQELNSGCLASDISPVQATTASGITPSVSSNASNLVFVSGVGDGVTATPTEHVVTFAGGQLTDTSYASTGGSPPTLQTAATWTFSSTPTDKHVLLTHVSQQVVSGVSVPMFQYYSYSNPSNTTAQSLIGASPLALPLSATWPATAGENNAAETIAQVSMAWVTAPSDGSTDPGRAETLQDSAVFRLTPATPGGPNYPCD